MQNQTQLKIYNKSFENSFIHQLKNLFDINITKDNA